LEGKTWMSNQSLFEKYGGFSTISILVSRFYDKVTEDEELAPYFEKLDMAKLIQHQTDFIGMVMGAPANQYTGRALAESHKRLRIEPAHFEKVGALLKEALQEGGVDERDIAVLMSVVQKTRNDVVRD